MHPDSPSTLRRQTFSAQRAMGKNSPARRPQSSLHDGRKIRDLGRVSFAEYATAWIKERPALPPNTIQTYQYVLARHIQPSLATGLSLTSEKPMSGGGAVSCSTPAPALPQSPRLIG